tara:strand:- start:308 stop:523 length:216 start_codon:yes stop_codon:yes gene_type:complete
MSIHSVTDIELGATGQLGSGTYIRDITIKAKSGWHKITLFADTSIDGNVLDIRATDKMAYNATDIKEASNV